MTVTYTLDPSNVPVDAVRLMAGDTDVSKAYLQDEEIQYFIDRYAEGGTPTEVQLINASIDAIRAIIVKIESALEEEQAGKVRVRLFNRKDILLDLITSLEKRLSTLAIPSVHGGGIDVTRVDNNRTDSTLVQPKFYKGLHDNPDSTEVDPEDGLL